MMAFAPPHQEHRSIMVGQSAYMRSNSPTQFQQEEEYNFSNPTKRQQETLPQKSNLQQKNKESILKQKVAITIHQDDDDDLHKPRPGVFSPPPRPIRSNVRPAAEMRTIRAKAEEQMDSVFEEKNEEQEQEDLHRKGVSVERSMSLDEASGLEQQKVLHDFRFNRPRLESAPSGSVERYRPRSHFSIPDIAVISADEEGNEIHYELQLEHAKRRMTFSTNNSSDQSSISPSSSKSTVLSSEGEGKVQALATRTASHAAKAQLATFTFPPPITANSNPTFKSKKLFNKSIKTSGTAPSIRVFDSEGQDQKYEQGSKSMSPTLASNEKFERGNQQFPCPPNNESIFESDSVESTIGSKIGKRLRKSSLPNLFGKKERDAANAAAKNAMPPSSPILKSAKDHQQQNTRMSSSVRQSSDPVVMRSKDDSVLTKSREESFDKIKAIEREFASKQTSTIWKRRMGQEENEVEKSREPLTINNQSIHSLPNSPEINIHAFSPPFSPKSPTQPYSPLRSFFGGGGGNAKANQVKPSSSIPTPSSPTFSVARPSSTSSLTKKEIKQRQKEEKNLIKELEKVDKMVRKHDQKAMKAQKKADEKRKKEEKKIQISGPMAVTVMPASSTLQSTVPLSNTNTPILSTLDSNHTTQSDPASISFQPSESTLTATPFDSPTTTVASRSDGTLYQIEVGEYKAGQIIEEDETSIPQENGHVEHEYPIVKPLQTSSSAPRISLPPSSATTFSLFDSLYREVDAMENSFGQQYPTEAQEHRKSMKLNSAPQSPTL